GRTMTTGTTFSPSFSAAAIDRWPTLSAPRADASTMAAWRQAGYWTDETRGRVLERSAAAWPDRIAVSTAEQDYDYAGLQARSAAVARTLLDEGTRPGDVVCWMLATGADAIAVAAAIWR